MLTRFEQNDLEALLAEFICERAATCPRANDDDYGIVVGIESSHRSILRSGRFGTGRCGRIGQPVQVVETVMKVTTDLIRRTLVSKLLPYCVIVVERHQLHAVYLLEERGTFVLLENSHLLVVGER